MPCNEPCYPCNQTPCADCPPPSVEVPCVNGEPCVEIAYSDCVEYTGVRLQNIDVNKGDRLTQILAKLDVNHASAGITTEDTTSVSLSGSGVDSSVLKATAIIDPDQDNLLSVTDDGLLVKFTQANVLQLFDFIKHNITLQAAWCDLIDGCSGASCGIVTGIHADMV